MRLLKYLFPGILFLVSVATAQSPADYGFQQIPQAPSDRVYNLLLDKKGFIWIGHDMGISRYDGRSFTSYYSNRQSALSISNLSEDSFGRIWCRNFNGQIFYIEDGIMKLIEGYDPQFDLSDFVIVGNELLARCREGIFIHDLTTKKSRIIRNTPGNIPLGTISESMYAYGTKLYFLLRRNNQYHLLRYDKGVFTHFNVHKENYNSVVYVNDRYILLKNHLNDSLTYFNIQGNRLVKVRTFKLDRSIIYAIPSVNKDQVWIHTPKQSILLNDTHKITGLSLTDYIKDREGNIWASSLVYGLLLKKRTPAWEFQPANKATEYISALTTWGDKVITGTTTGQVRITDTASLMQPDTVRTLVLNQKSVSGMLVSGDHLYIYGTPYIITLDKNFQVVNRIFSTDYISAATVIGDKMCVMATNKGMTAIAQYQVSLDHHIPSLPEIIATHFKYNTTYKLFENSDNKRRVRGIGYDPAQSILYAGFSNGLYAYSANTVRSVSFEHAPVYAYDIRRYQDEIYIATLNNGILVLKNGRFIHRLHRKNGLCAGPILKLKLFGTHLWILGVKDIQLYDVEQKAFINTVTYPPIEGGAVYDLLELNGHIYFSLTQGIYKVPFFEDRKKIPPLNYLQYVVVNSTDTIRNRASLSYKKNSLLFNLASLYYFDPNGVYFSYRLTGNGTDTNWKQSPPGQNEILFPYVMPGQYTFEAIAHTATGLAAEQAVIFSFTINKPWWQQLWFISGMLILITGVSYIFISMRIKSKREANRLIIERLKHEGERLEYENVANESELKALKSQMNPHFISNSLNTIQEMFMRGDRNAANEQLGNFAILTRLVLTVSGKKFILLATEIDILKKYLTLEKMRFGDNFNYHIIVDDEIDEGYIQIPPMIIQPFAENSVKHGLLHKEGERILTITFTATPENEYLVCTVTDNGVGRAKATEINKTTRFDHDSFSIATMKKRLNLMGKAMHKQFTIEYTDMKNQTGAATGTSVSISIPIFTS